MELEKKALIDPNRLSELPLIEQNIRDNYKVIFDEGTIKVDHYFKHPNIELPLVRIREETLANYSSSHSTIHTYLTVKHKVVKDGFEVNEEIEDESNQTFEGSAIKKLFESLGMTEYFTKEKGTYGTHVNVDGYDLHVEVVTVKSGDSKPVHAIEVECIVPEADQVTVEAVSQVIDKFFVTISNETYNLKDHIDGRSWKELLGA